MQSVSPGVGQLDTIGVLRSWRRGATDTLITVSVLLHLPAVVLPVSGAQVDGTMRTSAVSNIAGDDGTCSGSLTVKGNVACVISTVTTVTATGYTYDATGNSDPDGDSNGTTITITITT